MWIGRNKRTTPFTIQSNTMRLAQIIERLPKNSWLVRLNLAGVEFALAVSSFVLLCGSNTNEPRDTRWFRRCRARLPLNPPRPGSSSRQKKGDILLF